jgi:hypothetical protein
MKRTGSCFCTLSKTHTGTKQNNFCNNTIIFRKLFILVFQRDNKSADFNHFLL